jgi:hypothetical protein
MTRLACTLLVLPLVASCASKPKAPPPVLYRLVLGDLTEAEITYMRPILRQEFRVVDQEGVPRKIVPIQWVGSAAALRENILMVFQDAGMPVDRVEQQLRDFNIHSARAGFSKSGAR